MRILHIDTELTWRGGENQLRLLVEGLARTEAESFVAVRPESAAAARLKGLAPILEIPMRGGFDPRAAFALAAACDRHAIQVIDAHTSNAHALGLLTKVLRPKVKLVVHRRVDYPPKQGFIHRWKYQTPKVDQFVAISAAIRSVLLASGIAPERVTVVRSAVDGAPYTKIDKLAAKAELARAYGIDPQLLFLGNASALSQQKDYPTLLEAARLLKAQGHYFHLFIAGDGSERDGLEKQRIAAGLEHDVTFLGFIDDVPRFLSALDIFTLTSEYEGLGTILLEAAHAQLCVVATAAGGIPEIVRDGVTGLLAPTHDAQAFAMQVATVLSAADQRLKLAAALRQHARQDFSLKNMVEGNLEVYRRTGKVP